MYNPFVFRKKLQQQKTFLLKLFQNKGKHYCQQIILSARPVSIQLLFQIVSLIVCGVITINSQTFEKIRQSRKLNYLETNFAENSKLISVEEKQNKLVNLSSVLHLLLEPLFVK
jgi:hypothetical protein